jgi:O-antigen/teichoic acid export membrane protein
VTSPGWATEEETAMHRTGWARAGPGALARLHGAVGDPVVRNGYLLTGTAVVTSLLGVLFWAFAARLSSPAEVGRSAAAITALTLIANTAGLNLAGSLAYLLPRLGSGARRFIARTYLLTGGLAVVLGLGFLGVVWTGHADSLGYLAAGPASAITFTVAAPLFVLFTVQDGVLTGLRRASWVLVENMCFSVLKLVGVIVLATVGVTHGIFYSWAGAMVIVVPPMTVLIFRRLLPATAARPAEAGPPADLIRRFVGLQYLSAMLGQLYMNTLPLIVLVTLGGEANGLFYVPWTIATTVDLVSHSMGASLTVEGAREPDRLWRHVRAVAKRLGVLLGVGAVVGLLGTPLVLSVYGPEYVAADALLLRLLIVGAVLRAVVVLTQSATRARGHSAYTIATEAAVCALVLGVSIALLPIWGIEATGWAWLVGNGLVAAASVPTLIRTMRRPRDTEPGLPLPGDAVVAVQPVESPSARTRSL